MANLIAPSITLDKNTLVLTGTGGGSNTSHSQDTGSWYYTWSYGYEISKKNIPTGALIYIDRVITDATTFSYNLTGKINETDSIVVRQFEDYYQEEYAAQTAGADTFTYSTESNIATLPVRAFDGNVTLTIKPSSTLITQPNYTSDIKLTINATGLVTSIPAPLDGLSTLTLPVNSGIDYFNSRYMVEYSGNISLNIKGSNTVETYVYDPPTLPDISYDFITDELTINSLTHTKLKIYKADTNTFNYVLVKEILTSNATYVEPDLSLLLGTGNWRIMVRAENEVGRVTNDSNVIECGFETTTITGNLNVVRAVEVREGFIAFSVTPKAKIVVPADFKGDISLHINTIGLEDFAVSLPLIEIVELIGMRVLTTNLVGISNGVITINGNIDVAVHLEGDDSRTVAIRGETSKIELDSSVKV